MGMRESAVDFRYMRHLVGVDAGAGGFALRRLQVGETTSEDLDPGGGQPDRPTGTYFIERSPTRGEGAMTEWS